MTYVRFDIKKLIVTERSVFEGNVCFDNDVTIRGDLEIVGKINDIQIGSQGATIPQGLLGMWGLTRKNEEAGSQFANFDGNVGNKNSRDFFRPLTEANLITIQYTPGKEPRTLSYLYESSNNNDEFLATANIDTGLITYLPTTINNARGPVYDSTNDRFIALDAGGDILYSFDPTTGTQSVLTSGLGSNLTIVSDGVIIGDTSFFTEEGEDIQSNPMLTAVNKNTGTFIANITWSGSYIFSGTIFKDIGNEKVYSVALDPETFRLYFLLGNSDRRYLSYYQSTSLEQLEIDITSGNFDITICEQLPSEPLHAISWVPIPDNN